MKGFIVIFLFICGCNSHKKYNSSEFQFVEGVMNYKGNPFSGVLEKINGPIKQVIPYQNGFIHGQEIHYYQNGNKFKVRHYDQGLAQGNHKVFYPNGQLMKDLNFKDDVYEGDYTEFYESGQVYIYKKFKNGKAIGHKQWRKNGQIFANVVYKDGKRYGLYGGKLCYETEDIK